MGYYYIRRDEDFFIKADKESVKILCDKDGQIKVVKYKKVNQHVKV
jgi:hypothetical protein